MTRLPALFVMAALTMAAAPPPLATIWADTAAAARKADFHGHLIVADATAAHGEDVGNSTGPALWRWVSVSKQIVATLVMQEVDRGKVTLDTPIRTYAPNLQVANADIVTLRQLLQHTSGLPNVEDGPMNKAGTTLALFDRSTPAPGPGINAICRGPAKAAPGVRFEYNDCDTEVVGAVLEAVTGRPLETLLSQQLFAPLGMTGARLLKAGDDAGRPGLLPDGTSDDYIDVGRFGAAGAVAGPPAALARFDQALLAGRLMTPASRAEMWKGDRQYGFAALGQWVYTVPLAGCAEPVELVERRGGIGGVEIRNVIAPAKGRIVIAFADRPAAFGEPWQGKGLTYDLLSAAFCKAN
ncbi:MAG: serine hydrolase [Alphaproteobacteria bacterium]|nr:MAG: serine hydrolase [Alphaproteobacteria bacterium]